MTIKVGINGYGRIGRNMLRALYEGGKRTEIEIVAVNDLGDANTNALLTRRDTAHGRFPGTVEVDDDHMIVNGDRIRVLAERDPAQLPWGELGVDIVFESTGFFRTRETAGKHIEAGAKKVIISAPGGEGIDATIVYGVNHDVLKSTDTIISNASCTTNCLSPVAKVLNDAIGIKRGFMTTIHSYTGDQPTLDTMHKDLYRARAAAMNMIPTTTGAARAVGQVLPELAGKLDGSAIRVPVPNGSIVDLTVQLGKDVDVEAVNGAMREAAQGPLAGVLEFCTDPIVSTDIIGNPASSIFDAPSTMAHGNLAKVLSWYDNEWGYSSRVEELIAMVAALDGIGENGIR